MTPAAQNRIAFSVVVVAGVALMLLGILSAFNTHLAPDRCPGPSLDCFASANATLQGAPK